MAKAAEEELRVPPAPGPRLLWGSFPPLPAKYPVRPKTEIWNLQPYRSVGD